MSPAQLSAMTGVINDQGSFVNTLVDGIIHLRTTLSARCGYLLVGIQVDLIDVVNRVLYRNHIGKFLDLVQMEVSIPIIGDEANHIAPIILHRIALGAIVQDLIYRFGGFLK